MSDERIRLLEALPGWSWEMLWADAWETAFAALAQYVDREGTASVKRDHIEGGFALGTWFHNQRGNYRRQTIRTERAARLEALPGWTWNAKKELPPKGRQAARRSSRREL